MTETSITCLPFYCECGKTISIGQSSFINMGATFLDNAPITINSHVLIGQNAQFYIPSHPLDYRRRREWETRCLPITVADNVWIGGNVVICQGVRVGGQPAKLSKCLN